MLKKIKVPALLFLTSTFLSFIFLELSIHLFYKYIQSEKIYYSLYNTLVEHHEFDQEIQAGHDRNSTIEKYKALQKHLEIYAIGDSFTNSGNIISKSSYPAQLYQLLNRLSTVYNFGLCESSSSDALKVINEKISKISNSEQKKVIVLLSGVTDSFILNPINSETYISPEIIHQEILDKNLKHSTGFQIKTFSFIKLVFKLISNKLTFSTLINELNAIVKLKKQIINNHEVSCFQLNGQSKIDCLERVLTSLEIPIEQKRIIAIYLLKYYQNYEIKFDSHYYYQRMIDLLNYYDFFMKFLEQDDVDYMLSPLTLLFQLQSEMGPKEFIQKIDALIAKYNSQFNFTLTKKQLSTFELNQIALAKVRQKRLENYKSIWAKAKDLKTELIMMTYPLPYHEVNNQIRQFAHENQIHLIDLEELFAR
ncbi:MAG: hypothetical protein OHK0056_28340 [Bacteriovoracaceae bacterium]